MERTLAKSTGGRDAEEDITSDYSIKAVSLYAPVAYMDKELDHIYDYGNLSPGEQEQWSSEQSGTENM